MHIKIKIVLAFFIGSALLFNTAVAKTVHLRKAGPVFVDSLFFPDTAEGWSNYPAYAEIQGDSVLLEVVLIKNTTSANHSWQEFLLAGNIAAAITPVAERTFEYNEPERKWEIKIMPDGRLYLRFISGKQPAGNPAIIPVQTKFKK